jgi:trk system potassium uptake protein TrkH
MFIADPIVLGIMGSLIFLGTISYLATADVIRLIRVRGRGVMTFLHLRRRVVEDEGPRQRTLSLNTKLVLILTAVLTLAGATMFFSSEHDNPKTMGALDLSDKIVVSLFESTSDRTAGFSTVDYSETAQHTNFFFTSLMFIGGASASVAGGIKINTLAVVLVAVISTLGGRSHARAFHREIPHSQVQRATSIVGVALLCVFAVVLALTFPDGGMLS